MDTKKLIRWIAILGLGLIGSSAQALEPPTREQLEQYRRDGSLQRRIEAARTLGNHLMSPHLSAAFDPSADQIKASVPKGLPTIGTQRVLTLLVDFEDFSGYSEPDAIHDQLFGEGLGGHVPYESLRAFYRRSSYGLLEIDGTTLGWYTTEYPRSEVEQTTQGREALIREIIGHFDAEGHDFTQYDNDGDGVLDYVIIIWAGPHQDWAEFWWGYKTNFRDPSFTVDGKRLGTYSWQWENYSYPGPFNPEVVIHETGHALGLPDYYDYDETIGPDGGVGGLDQMDANWGDHNCFSKWVLGWLEPTVYNESSHGLLLAANDEQPDAAVLMHGDPRTDPNGEYFMIQYRRRQGNDLEYPTDGLLIWHVDARTDDNGRWLYDNSYTEHKLLRLMEADGLEEIESNSMADADDFYTSGDLFGNHTTPNSNRYDGAPTNLLVDNIAVGATETSLQADLGSGCALFCEASGPRSSWPRTPQSFTGSVSGENCDGEAATAWYLDDAVMSEESSLERAFPAGSYDWSFTAELGDASCSKGGPFLVCADERCWQWSQMAPMNSARAQHAAVSLADGGVLLAGGGGPAELFEPDGCSCRLTSPSTGAFDGVQGVALRDGRVLLCGASLSDEITAEIYDPATDTWTVTEPMEQGRFDHSAIALRDGRVLVAGGVRFDDEGNVVGVHTTEVFDPSAGHWTEVGTIDEDLIVPGLSLLLDGRVLLTGNRTGAIFDPASDSWGEPFLLSFERVYHVSVTLPSGRVLLAGGQGTRHATVWDPVLEREQFAGSLSMIRIFPSAVILANGKVLLSGGMDLSYEATGAVEIFDPATSTWMAASAMSNSRLAHATNLLPNGDVLVTGGVEPDGGSYVPTDSVEVYNRPTSAPMRAGGRRHP